eukprot:XP_015579384.1 transcription termination factor MTERF8, chloroplastic [Ricinus communis]
MISDTHLCKFLRHVKCATRASPTHAICCSRKCPSLLLSSVRCISSKASVDKQSFIVTYLINNCGLSPKSALSASKYLRFKTPHKPDSTLAFLKSHGFSKTQITKVIHTRPAVLSSDPERTLLPKIQFFHSKGFSGPDIAKILSACPEILHTSIENQLIPAVNFIQNLLPSNDKVVYAIKRLPKIMLSQPLGYAICNMKLLKEAGLPESSIVWLLRYHPTTLMTKLDRFAEIIEGVKGLGLNPSVISFVIAIHAMRGMSKSTWEKKFDIYEKWGWSQEETLVVFGKFPWVMMYSEKKIMKMMDYYINKMGWDSSYIAKHPLLIALSLENRVIPRCSVLQVLLSKNLIRLTSIATPLRISDKLFLHKFVTPYKEEAPHLLKLYQKKLNVAKCEGKGKTEQKQLQRQ